MDKLKYVLSVRRTEIRSGERFKPMDKEELEAAITAACTRRGDFSPLWEKEYDSKEEAMQAFHDQAVDFTFGCYGVIHTLTIEEAMVEIHKRDEGAEEYYFVGAAAYKLPTIDWGCAM